MKKILLFGAQGMLGMQFVYDYEDTFEIIPLDQGHLDLEHTSFIIPEIEKYTPHAVINAAAWTAVDKAENSKFQESIQKINIDAPRAMARGCKKLDIPFFHVSTDFVFSGQSKEAKFLEDDVKHPINFYGKTKSDGEDAALSAWEKTYIIRTAWLYGPYGPNFVIRVLQLAKKREALKIVNDQFGNPTWSKYVAKVIADFIHTPQAPGIYHAVSEVGDIPPSWHDFADQIFRITGQSITMNPVPSNKFEQAAERPLSSVLLNTKLPQLPSWQDMLQEFLKN